MSYLAFISYRRDSGRASALYIKSKLESKYEIEVFMDDSGLEVGRYDSQLAEHIEKAPYFIVILSENSLDERLVEVDWFKKEILYAFTKEKIIIPVLHEKFAFPLEKQWQSVPKEMQTLNHLHGVNYLHPYEDAAIDRIAGLMLIEIPSKILHLYGKNEIFITNIKSTHTFIDIPINLLTFFGLSRIQMTGILLNYKLEIKHFKSQESKLQSCSHSNFRSRKWIERTFETKNDEFDLSENQLLGVIIQIDFTGYSDKDINNTVQGLSTMKQYIDYKYSINKPIIIISIQYQNPNTILKFFVHNTFANTYVGFSPDRYYSEVISPQNRWECINTLRRIFEGNFKEQINRSHYLVTPLISVIDLAQADKSNVELSEKTFLKNITDKKLFSAIQCGYQFKIPYESLVNILREMSISEALICLHALTIMNENLSIENLTTWTVAQLSYLCLFDKQHDHDIYTPDYMVENWIKKINMDESIIFHEKHQ